MSTNAVTPTKALPHATYVQGIFKFTDSISTEELIETAREMLASDPDRYISLTVRRCSSDQRGICLIFNLEGPSGGYAMTHKSFFNSCKDRLYRKYGVGFLGWDWSDEIFVVK